MEKYSFLSFTSDPDQESVLDKRQLPPIAFFIAIKFVDEKEQLMLKQLKDYLTKLYVSNKIGHTILAYEISQDSHKETCGEHIHIFTHMEEKTYHTLAQCLFKKKWNLRGRAETGKPKQYGKLTSIRDRNKMVAYTIKGGNIETTYSEIYLLPYFKMSYVKVDKYQDMKARVLLHFKDTQPTIDEVAIFIIDYHRSKGYNRPQLSYIRNIFTDFQYDYKPQGTYLYTSKDIWNIMQFR